jgi:hypothetical protein
MPAAPRGRIYYNPTYYSTYYRRTDWQIYSYLAFARRLFGDQEIAIISGHPSGHFQFEIQRLREMFPEAAIEKSGSSWDE